MQNINLFKKFICINLTALMFAMQLLPVMANDTFYDFSDEAQERFNSQNLTPIPQMPTKETPSKKRNKQTENETANINTNTSIPPLQQNTTLKGGLVYISEGATFQAVLQSSISSESLAKDDTIASVLSSDWVHNGVLIAPQGSIVYGKAIDAQKTGFFYKNGEISIMFNELITPTGDKLVLESNIVTVRVDGGRGKKIAANVAAGAAIGMLSGVLRGLLSDDSNWKTVLIVGASLGVAGGLINAGAHKGEAVEIPAGTGINVRLTKPMQAEPYKQQG